MPLPVPTLPFMRDLMTLPMLPMLRMVPMMPGPAGLSAALRWS
ncbi:MAG: hypothetical protein V4617_13320 [Gemmatimonadota bacterium]